MELRLRGEAAPLLRELVHAMGQPLTAMQLLRLPTFGGPESADPRRLLVEMAEQAELTTGVYRAVQLLIDSSGNDVDTTDVSAMVRGLESHWRRRALRRGAELRVELEGASVPVRGGSGVLQALDRIFDALLSGLPTGSIVTVRGSQKTLIFTSDNLSGAEIAETYILRVARVLIEGTGGSVVYAARPMSARVQFAQA